MDLEMLGPDQSAMRRLINLNRAATDSLTIQAFLSYCKSLSEA
jgi:hypothetical protein